MLKIAQKVSFLWLKQASLISKKNLWLYCFAPYKFFWILSNSWFLQYEKNHQELKRIFKGQKSITKGFEKFVSSKTIIFKHSALSLGHNGSIWPYAVTQMHWYTLAEKKIGNYVERRVGWTVANGCNFAFEAFPNVHWHVNYNGPLCVIAIQFPWKGNRKSLLFLLSIF